MLTLLGLSISFAGALVLVIGVALQPDKKVRRAVSTYAGSEVSMLITPVVAARHDSRAGAGFLAAGFVLQFIGAAGLVTWPTTSAWGIVVPVILAIVLVSGWCLTRSRFVDRDQEQILHAR
jgi:hypothetical protein